MEGDYIEGEGLAAKNREILEECIQDMKAVIGGIAAVHESDRLNEGLFLLVGVLYRAVSINYVPIVRRYLYAVLTVLEEELLSGVFLRGVLRLYEREDYEPTPFAKELAGVRPVRSANFDQTGQSLLKSSSNFSPPI